MRTHPRADVAVNTYLITRSPLGFQIDFDANEGEGVFKAKFFFEACWNDEAPSISTRLGVGDCGDGERTARGPQWDPRMYFPSNDLGSDSIRTADYEKRWVSTMESDYREAFEMTAMQDARNALAAAKARLDSAEATAAGATDRAANAKIEFGEGADSASAMAEAEAACHTLARARETHGALDAATKALQAKIDAGQWGGMTCYRFALKHLVSFRYDTTDQPLTMESFPFDHHVLSLLVRSKEAEELHNEGVQVRLHINEKYPSETPRTRACSLYRAFNVAKYPSSELDLHKAGKVYMALTADTVKVERRYHYGREFPQIKVQFEIHRRANDWMYQAIVPILVSSALCGLSFMPEPCALGDRQQVSLGALFTLVAFHLGLKTMEVYPKVPYIMFIDRLVLFNLFIMVRIETTVRRWRSESSSNLLTNNASVR